MNPLEVLRGLGACGPGGDERLVRGRFEVDVVRPHIEDVPEVLGESGDPDVDLRPQGVKELRTGRGSDDGLLGEPGEDLVNRRPRREGRLPGSRG